MGITRYRDGEATVTLTGDLEAFVRAAVTAASGGVVETMERAAEEVAAQARRQWYAPATGVTRRTGASGQLDVITTVTHDEVRVSVGSTDTRLVRNARGRMVPRASVIQRPGPLSQADEYVTQGEWWAWKKSGRPVGKHGTKGKADWIIHVPSDNASDGAFLVPELVRKPMTAKIKVITPDVARAIAARVSRG
jgi:hypothetical protein